MNLTEAAESMDRLIGNALLPRSHPSRANKFSFTADERHEALARFRRGEETPEDVALLRRNGIVSVNGREVR